MSGSIFGGLGVWASGDFGLSRRIVQRKQAGGGVLPVLSSEATSGSRFLVGVRGIVLDWYSCVQIDAYFCRTTW